MLNTDFQGLQAATTLLGILAQNNLQNNLPAVIFSHSMLFCTKVYLAVLSTPLPVIGIPVVKILNTEC